MDMAFVNEWAWLIAIGLGIVLVILELLIGIDTGFDLVFIGSAFALGGLITIAFNSWIWTAIVSGIICVLYVIIGRRYMHRRTYVPLSRTNIDTVIGKTGVVEDDIDPVKGGRVKVGTEQWRARAENPIKKGEIITVTGVSGVTLSVKKIEGGKE